MDLPVSEKVRGIMADVFSLPIEDFTPESSPDSIEKWDSLRHINLVLAIEQRFDLSLTPEEIEQMLSVELVTMLVEEKLVARR